MSRHAVHYLYSSNDTYAYGIANILRSRLHRLHGPPFYLLSLLRKRLELLTPLGRPVVVHPFLKSHIPDIIVLHTSSHDLSIYSPFPPCVREVRY